MTIPPGRQTAGGPGVEPPGATAGGLDPVFATADRAVAGFEVVAGSGTGPARRAAAFQAAAARRVPAHAALFLPAGPPEGVAEGTARYAVVNVISVTDAVGTAAALAAAAAAAGRGERVALGCEGAPAARALMELIGPDVIRLGPALVQTPGVPGTGAAIAAAQAHSRLTGAVIMATGIETAAQLAFARSVGAALGQGPALRRAGRLLPAGPQPAGWLPRLPRAVPVTSPFAAAAARAAPSPVGRPAMMQLSRALQDDAGSNGSAVVLASVQHRRHLGAPAARRYRQLAARTALTAVLGSDMPPAPAPGVHGFPLDDGDPLTAEWAVIAIGDRHAAGLFGQEQPGGGFHAVISEDRQLVSAAAWPLIQRMIPGRP